MRVVAVAVGALMLPLSAYAQLAAKADPDDSVGFGRLNAEECSRYGIRYGYAECNRFRKRPTQFKEASTVGGQHQARAATPAIAPKAGPAKTATLAPAQNASSPRKGEIAKDRVRQMAGQLILMGFDGREPGDEGVVRLEAALRRGNVSGAVIKDGNVSSVQQLQRLVRSLGEAAAERPVIVAAEQPGGPDSVLPEEKGFEPFPSASAVGGAESTAAARSIYRTMALDLARLGFNMNIGPSEDACENGGVDLSASCFASTPLLAAAYAAAFSAGHRDGGVFAVLRHEVDRHGFDAVRMKQSPAQAMLRVLLMREAGDALMVRAKASESAAMLKWFRRARAFRGLRPYDVAGRLVIMDFVIDRPSAPLRYGEILARAIDAGADMVLVRNSSGIPGDVPTAFADALFAGVTSKRIQTARIEAAFEKVQRLKARLTTRGEPRTEVARLDR